jgi:hypothetical protein
MRKRLVRSSDVADTPDQGSWIDLSVDATVELTSEDPSHPVENALQTGRSGQWIASSEGTQAIRLWFDKPQRIHRIVLEFVERDCERTQEFAIFVATHLAPKPMEVIRQRWNFSPDGSTEELEDYEVDFSGVNVLELRLSPDVGGGPSRATLSRWRVA